MFIRTTKPIQLVLNNLYSNDNGTCTEYAETVQSVCYNNIIRELGHSLLFVDIYVQSLASGSGWWGRGEKVFTQW